MIQVVKLRIVNKSIVIGIPKYFLEQLKWEPGERLILDSDGVTVTVMKEGGLQHEETKGDHAGGQA